MSPPASPTDQLPQAMQVIEITTPGDPSVLVTAQRDLPRLKSGEVLIKVAAAGINRPDVLQRKGMYPPPSGASDIPGLEVAGEIVSLGTTDPALTGFKLGDQVCALVSGGGYAQYVAAPVGQCLPVPKGMDMLHAACLPETFFTVWSNVFDRARLGSVHGKQEVLLVHGGTSGIGTTAIQLAAAMGYTVLATAGTDDKCFACEQLGAKHGINYKVAFNGWHSVVKAVTNGRGVDVILDMVGGSYWDKNVECLADDGRIVLIATIGGNKASIDLAQMMRRRLTFTGSTLRARDVAFKGSIAQSLKTHVWPLLESGQIAPKLFQTFPLEQAAQAHSLMESSAHIGKIALQVEH